MAKVALLAGMLRGGDIVQQVQKIPFIPRGWQVLYADGAVVNRATRTLRCVRRQSPR